MAEDSQSDANDGDAASNRKERYLEGEDEHFHEDDCQYALA